MTSAVITSRAFIAVRFPFSLSTATVASAVATRTVPPAISFACPARQLQRAAQLGRAPGYDNETGKGKHRHFGATETACAFATPDALLADFWKDVDNWRPK